MKKNRKKKGVVKTEHLVTDESFALHKSKGNGILRRQIWQNAEGEVTRYSLAYINHQLFAEDNGRVLGYDNAHGYHHKHVMGKIESVSFENFTELEEQFQQEFEVMHDKIKKK